MTTPIDSGLNPLALRTDVASRNAKVEPAPADQATTPGASADSFPGLPLAGQSQIRLDDSFDAMDLNGDGVITRAEYQEYERLKAEFKRLDTNGDGKISLDEFVKGMAGQSEPAMAGAATDSSPVSAGDDVPSEQPSDASSVSNQPGDDVSSSDRPSDSSSDPSSGPPSIDGSSSDSGNAAPIASEDPGASQDTGATPATGPITPAAPAGTKPPILKQYAFPRDPAVATYGASGSDWLDSATPESSQEIAQVLADAQARNETPVFTQYSIPDRDNGGGSAGGAANPQAYLEGVAGNARAIGNAAAVVVIEPDALAEGKDPALIKQAVDIYRAQCPNARIYIDAGHSTWPSDPKEMADKLMQAGVQEADGFALNVSNFQWTTDNMNRGHQILAAMAAQDPALASKQFVVDTSRNGNGPGVDESGNPTWGDPVRAQNGGPIMNGPLPTPNTGDPSCAAFLWIKGAGYGDFRTRSAFQFGGTDWVTPNPNPPLGPT